MGPFVVLSVGSWIYGSVSVSVVLSARRSIRQNGPTCSKLDISKLVRVSRWTDTSPSQRKINCPWGLVYLLKARLNYLFCTVRLTDVVRRPCSDSPCYGAITLFIIYQCSNSGGWYACCAPHGRYSCLFSAIILFGEIKLFINHYITNQRKVGGIGVTAQFESRSLFNLDFIVIIIIIIIIIIIYFAQNTKTRKIESVDEQDNTVLWCTLTAAQNSTK